MKLPERERDTEIVESVSHAVGEAADDEERHTEKKRKILLLAGKLNGCGHYEAASYAQKSATDGSGTKTKLEDPLSGRLYFQWSHASKKGSNEASYDISEKDHEQLPNLAFVNESGCTCIKFQFITYYGKESEREEHCSGKRAIGLRLNSGRKETETGCSDSDAGKY
jgi:hypothetical protein